MTKWVYLFKEVEDAEKHAGDWEGVRGLLGGKGANLAEMTRVGLPVPPGFVVTTEACNAYLAAGEKFPDEVWQQSLTAMAAIEQETGKKLGDPSNPLLVSCRSGAKFSMPGMMDTVLNIGLNDKVVEGMAELTGDPRFAYDSFRRLVQMFGSVVMGIDDEPFEEVLAEARKEAGVKTDAELNADQWKAVTKKFEKIFEEETGRPFPQDPQEQIKLATEAVFKSWNGKRAIDYRNAAGIAHDLGTAVNIVTMVFGNMGNTSGTGVAFTRDPSTGENVLYGDYLINAQGEDVVAGIRNTNPIKDLEKDMPEVYQEFVDICQKLEDHYREMQDLEFTFEQGKLWMLQTRDGKRTAKASIKIAVDMAEDGFITKEQAILRVTPEQVDTLLHPQFDIEAKKTAAAEGNMLTKAVNASPGAAVGIVAFDADLTEKWGKEEHKPVIMVRPFTRPDDVHGMLSAKGILTSEGGATSHAAVVARQFGVPCVVGASDIVIDQEKRQFTAHGVVIKEGDWISIDGTTGEAFAGEIPTVSPSLEEQTELQTLLSWADGFRRLQIWTNADYPADAQRARSYGAQGIGLCRTEHMFFEQERLPTVQKMILAENEEIRQEALDKLLPYQRQDFAGLFETMTGLPVIIRLIDPPLHEFMPDHDEVFERVITKRVTGETAGLQEDEELLSAVSSMHESNPMMGLRGVRLSVVFPGLVKMQVRAIFEAACQVKKKGLEPKPEVMIPLAGHVNELKVIQPQLEEVAKAVMDEQGVEVEYKFGTMIEIPRAALTAGDLAEVAEFFSFGTNDLTQMTFGYSRDDAEAGFLLKYVDDGILPKNPFQTIDQDGVGKLMKMAVEAGRQTRPDLEVGICGEHGGDPASIAFCHSINQNYVSCSPFRVPVARLAAAQAALKEKGFTAK
ncbi:MAG: pyruvate, phosphate dikinase [Anaerolineae bacterium]|nr:pyruvate, phosphate dikinase [Anaerolineae bacterium]MCB0224639.1 pyruvate, phosphate dikinase [Anaerolineae bacterium]MCB9105187.1 pyruvate, phosphate dikinase [Anaerolineales bacterium]